MSYTNTWSPATLQSGAGGEWAARPRYTVSDFVTLMWRDRRLMLAVFLAIFVVGAAAALMLKTQYPAKSSILVRLGQEYVYQPSVGDAARGAIPNTDQLIQSEMEILSSVELRRRVISSLGFGRVFPDKAAAYAAADGSRKRELLDKAASAMGSNLKVDAAPDSSVVRVTYSDTNPDRAALVLNKLLDEYLVYRRSVLVDGDESSVDQQLKLFQQKLSETDAAYQAFLTSNDIGDFDTERTSLNSLLTSMTDESYRVQARLKEIDGRLGEIGRQMGQINPEVSLYHDSNPATSDKLLQLQIERQDLLSRYKPDAQPVREIDQRIGQMQAMLNAGAGQATGARRVGVNPVFQTVQTEQLQLSAEGASLRQRQGAITDQLAQITARRQKLTELEPQYLDLTRDRDLLQAEIKGLLQKQQESQANESIAKRNNDNIRIVERPAPPAHGKSLRRPLLILAFLFAAFTAVCTGLVRIFLRRGFATSSSASRTLDLPVLAAAGLKNG